MRPVIDLDKEYGLVLEGGGAKGAYQIGAWQALKEAGVKIKGISGTSVGALNGALICQEDLQKARNLWTNIRYSKIMDVDDDKMERLFDGEISVKEALGDLARIIGERGFDITPLKNLIAENLEEDKIINSGKDFLITTYSVTDMEPMTVDMTEILPEQMKDLLLASAYLPVFRNEKLHGKTFLDGGVYDVIPVEPLIQRGYQDIIMIRIFGVGREKKVLIPEDVNVYSIEPKVDLGNIIDFNSEKSKRNIVTGYYDAQRFLYGLTGTIYYIEQKEEECYYLEKLLHVSKEVLRELSELYRLREEPEYLLRNLTEELLPRFASDLKLGRHWNYEQLYLAMLESTARLVRVPKYQIYTIEQLQDRIMEKLEEEYIELPDFSRLIINK